MLQIKDDNGTVTPATIDEILAWREWSERERIRIFAVANGDLRRISTDHDGKPCDIEKRAANDRT